MSDETGADDGADDTAGTPGSFGSSGIRAPWAKRDPAKEDEDRHSALVGFMSVPVHRRFPVRRSTLIMAVAFIGLGTLLYLFPASSTSTGVVVHTNNGTFFVPGATPVNPSTTTTTTTTTRPHTTTTRVPTTTSTTRVNPSTTTTSTQSPVSTSTTSVGGSGTTTTTTSPGSTGTSTSLGGTTTTSP